MGQESLNSLNTGKSYRTRSSSLNLVEPKRRSHSVPIRPLKIIPSWERPQAEPPSAKQAPLPVPEQPPQALPIVPSPVHPPPLAAVTLPVQMPVQTPVQMPMPMPVPVHRKQVKGKAAQGTPVKERSWHWLTVWLSAACILGGMGTSAFLWLTGLPPLPECQVASTDSAPMQRLYCAQQVARSGKLPNLIRGIELLKGWSPDQPFYEKAQQSIDEWSALVLLNAREKVNQNDLAGGLAAASQIPVSSAVYQHAQKAIAAWKSQWHKGDVLYAKAEVAMQTQRWREATALVTEMGFMDYDYWRIQQADALAKRVLREKEARQALTQAQKLAKGNNPAKLGEAIAALQAIPTGTMAFPEAAAAQQQWSQALLAWALQQWQQGQTDNALIAAQAIPFNPNLPPEGKDLIQLSQAQQQMSDLTTLPIAEQLWHLLEATAAVQQIGTNSAFYVEAQKRSQSWLDQLQDVTQLQFADLLANLGDRASLQAAIDRASQITPDRPGRLTAQSLIAHWQQDLQKLSDRPYLSRAQAMASAGDRQDLQQAIAQAQVIPTSHPIWQEAQAQILKWQTQIEVLEDRPVLDSAIALAKQNKLAEAIQAAGRIHRDRALSDQAQAQIQVWQAQIRRTQIAQDQPILTQATALADRGHLTMAIELADRIQPNRELYDQAQQSIRAWSEERTDAANQAAANQAANQPTQLDESSDVTSSDATGSDDSAQ